MSEHKEEEYIWVMSSSLSPENIEEYGRGILDHPSMTISLDNEPKQLYTKEQLLKMFHVGCMTMAKEEMKSAVTITDNVPYYVLKNMEVGEFAVFPYKNWNATRAAASSLKKDFGAEFTVRKTGPHGKKGDIRVVRIK